MMATAPAARATSIPASTAFRPPGESSAATTMRLTEPAALPVPGRSSSSSADCIVVTSLALSEHCPGTQSLHPRTA